MGRDRLVDASGLLFFLVFALGLSPRRLDRQRLRRHCLPVLVFSGDDGFASRDARYFTTRRHRRHRFVTRLPGHRCGIGRFGERNGGGLPYFDGRSTEAWATRSAWATPPRSPSGAWATPRSPGGASHRGGPLFFFRGRTTECPHDYSDAENRQKKRYQRCFSHGSFPFLFSSCGLVLWSDRPQFPDTGESPPPAGSPDRRTRHRVLLPETAPIQQHLRIYHVLAPRSTSIPIRQSNPLGLSKVNQNGSNPNPPRDQGEGAEDCRQRPSPVFLRCVPPQWLTGPSPLRDTRNGGDGGRGLAGRTRRGPASNPGWPSSRGGTSKQPGDKGARKRESVILAEVEADN